MTYKGRYTVKNPKKYVGDINKVIYRSSWELRCMNYFDQNENVLKWSSEELAIPYISPIDKRWHRYYPDFVIQMLDEQNRVKTVMIEVKPHKQTKPPAPRKRTTKRYIQEVKDWGINTSKWKAAQEYCADRKWEFKILTENELGIS
jgi:hypothetical protein|tara:strand:- start:1241 stop:1678 length:438 start_codon:yes stop_codon:yes gene_type:complete